MPITNTDNVYRFCGFIVVVYQGPWLYQCLRAKYNFKQNTSDSKADTLFGSTFCINLCVPQYMLWEKKVGPSISSCNIDLKIPCELHFYAIETIRQQTFLEHQGREAIGLTWTQNKMKINKSVNKGN